MMWQKGEKQMGELSNKTKKAQGGAKEKGEQDEENDSHDAFIIYFANQLPFLLRVSSHIFSFVSIFFHFLWSPLMGSWRGR
jgi:hypothetical protein